MGIPTLISTATASNASSVDITSGIDSTYDEYMFVFTDIGPATNTAQMSFQVNAADQSGFNETITSTYFLAWNYEDGSTGQGLAYQAGADLEQGTGYQVLTSDTGSGADESCAGILHLFSPSNTTYVKHFYSDFSSNAADDSAQRSLCAGYINVTAAIDEISFKMSSGNFDGVIQLFGIA